MQFELATKVPCHFVGSIAYYLKDELEAVLNNNDLVMGKVLRKPIDGLVEFHRKTM